MGLLGLADGRRLHKAADGHEPEGMAPDHGRARGEMGPEDRGWGCISVGVSVRYAPSVRRPTANGRPPGRCRPRPTRPPCGSSSGEPRIGEMSMRQTMRRPAAHGCTMPRSPGRQTALPSTATPAAHMKYMSRTRAPTSASRRVASRTMATIRAESSHTGVPGKVRAGRQARVDTLNRFSCDHARRGRVASGRKITRRFPGAPGVTPTPTDPGSRPR
jgi:hypothetical protein